MSLADEWSVWSQPQLLSTPQPMAGLCLPNTGVSTSGVHGLGQEVISQPQGCLGMSPQDFNLKGLCSTEGAGSGDSWEEMAPHLSFFTPSYRLIPEKQMSSVPSVPQHPFPSTAGHVGSISSPLETELLWDTRLCTEPGGQA